MSQTINKKLGTMVDMMWEEEDEATERLLGLSREADSSEIKLTKIYDMRNWDKRSTDQSVPWFYTTAWSVPSSNWLITLLIWKRVLYEMKIGEQGIWTFECSELNNSSRTMKYSPNRFGSGYFSSEQNVTLSIGILKATRNRITYLKSFSFAHKRVTG